MKKIRETTKITEPENQLKLYGYKNYFDSFAKLFEYGNLPNTILLSGPKGLGKSTFSYHFINYMLSKDQQKNYSIEKFIIDENNLNYKLLSNNIHPNFFIIKNKGSEKDIKIDQVRNLLKFLNKSTYSKDLKIVMIDNVEHFNLNSSNALLKCLEEPQNNTFFFIIHNSASKILDTIKSRCIEFKIFFTKNEKKDIFKNIHKQYISELIESPNLENLYFDTPGNLIRYLSIFSNFDLSKEKDELICIYHLMNEFKVEKNPQILFFLILSIERFYNRLILENVNKSSSYFFNYSKILKNIDNMKKFGLDDKSIFIWIKNILNNETK